MDDDLFNIEKELDLLIQKMDAPAPAINQAILDQQDAEAEREAIQNEPRTKKSVNNIFESMGGFVVRKDYTDSIGSEEFLIDNVVIKNHIVTIIGESGAGKTAYFFFHGARYMAERGAKVYYIDADSPPSDHKKMMEFREKHGFDWIIPDVNEGQSVEKFKKTLVDLAKSQCEMEDTVFIFDTLKKFVNTMSKDSIKRFYALMRKITKLGATVVLLGHANKYRDSDGNMIFEGVNDVRSDSDDLIFFSHHTTRDNGTDVTTMIDASIGAKVRGLFQPFSFHIDKYRDITFYDQALTPIELMNQFEMKATDTEILETATEYLSKLKEPIRQNQFIEYVRAKIEGEAGINRIRKIIIRNSILKGDPQPAGTKFIYSVGDKNVHLYELLKIEKQGELFK
jgi:hypothetical protein